MSSLFISYAISLTEFKKYNEAEAMYKKAIEFAPKQPNAYILLANLYSTQNRVKEAIELYRKALRVEPNNAETYMFLGNAHYLDKDIEQAISSYRASIGIAPDNDEYRLIYSQVVDDYVKSARGEV